MLQQVEEDQRCAREGCDRPRAEYRGKGKRPLYCGPGCQPGNRPKPKEPPMTSVPSRELAPSIPETPRPWDPPPLATAPAAEPPTPIRNAHLLKAIDGLQCVLQAMAMEKVSVVTLVIPREGEAVLSSVDFRDSVTDGEVIPMVIKL